LTGPDDPAAGQAPTPGHDPQAVAGPVSSDPGQLDVPSPPPGAPAAAPNLDADGLPRLGAFSLEGRAVPALFLIGWFASVLGGSTILVSFFAAGTAAARWLFLAGLLVLALGLVAAVGSQSVERARRPSLPFRGPSPVPVFLVVIVVSLLAIVIVLAPMSALGLDPSSPVATAISLAITTAIFLAAVQAFVVGPGGMTWRDMGFGVPAREALANLGVGIALAPLVVAVALVLTAVLSSLLARPPSALPESGDLLGLLANLASAAVLAPLGEEVFFRGFATTAWARSIGTRPAIVRGAVFFAFAHVLTVLSASFSSGLAVAAVEFLALLPAGVVLGWVFLARRSVWASIGLHGAYNAIQVLLVFAVLRGG
jgi:membrane protease YdiL (CAAX protease family)